MKFRSAWTLAIVVVLACLAVWAVSYIERIPPKRLASLLGITVTVSDINSPGVSPSPRFTPVGGDVASSMGLVAVQTFSGPALIRQGTATAVSADGLILTTSLAAPYGSGSYLYQVATPRGQILRAVRVASDAASGLVLLKADATDLDAVLFDVSSPVAGQQLQAVSSQIQVSQFVPIRLPVWVVWSASRTTLSLDRSFISSVLGARLVDAQGRSVGMVGLSTQPTFIDAGVINAFIEKYLSRPVTH